MARGARTFLTQTTLDRETGIVEIQKRRNLAQLLRRQHGATRARQMHRIAATTIGITLVVGVKQVDNAALRHHRVKVQILLHGLPELHGELIKRLVARQQIIRTHDGGVAANIARPQPALLQHRNAALLEGLGQVIGCSQPVTTAANDDEIIIRLRLRVAPKLAPSFVAGQCLFQNPDARETHCVTPSLLSLWIDQLNGCISQKKDIYFRKRVADGTADRILSGGRLCNDEHSRSDGASAGCESVQPGPAL